MNVNTKEKFHQLCNEEDKQTFTSAIKSSAVGLFVKQKKFHYSILSR